MAKVLVVDDDLTFLEYAKAAISQLGFEVLTASDGMMALEIFGQEQPEMVFTDITMPKLNGEELIKKIRMIDKNVPIIVISGNEDYKNRTMLNNKIPATFSMFKPICLDDFIDILGISIEI